MDRNDRTIAKHIVLAIGYTDQFMYPLRRSEIWQRMVGVWDESRISRISFNQTLARLKRERVLQQKNSMFSLSSERHSADEYVSIRKDRAAFAKQKKAESSELIAFLKRLPWVTGVLITGSVAMNNAIQDDDVDFLIITKPGSLWFVRPLVVGFSWIKKKRRSWKKEEKNSWCFNFWLDENHLTIPKQNRSIYTAYELLQAEFVLAEPQVARMYYSCNLWARRILPEYYKSARPQSQQQLLSQEELEKREAVRLFYKYPVIWLNELLYWVQQVYMMPHKTSEQVGRGFAFFHPRDTRTQVFENWKTSLKRLVY
ncbi:hypothetical protein KC721_03190 [Candidatus Woesebacteria bacterium]|nr:hypothetical protein [Candidatus Woesebacteria bacterium]